MFLVLDVFLGWVRCVGVGGRWVDGSFQRWLGGVLVMMGWLSSSWDSLRASMSILYSRYSLIGGMEALISMAIMGVVLNALVVRHRHVFWSLLR